MIALAERLRADGWAVMPATHGVRLHATRAGASVLYLAPRPWCCGGARDEAPAVPAAWFSWRVLLRALFSPLPPRPRHPLMPAAARAGRWPGY